MKQQLIHNIRVYENATPAKRMKYARYLAEARKEGRTPEVFIDWLKSQTQCPA